MTESNLKIFKTFKKLIEQNPSSKEEIILSYEISPDTNIAFVVDGNFFLYLEYNNEDGYFDYFPIISTNNDAAFIIFDNNDKFPNQILDDIEIHTDLELILKYGREISDDVILRKINDFLIDEINAKELKIKDLDNFFDGRVYSPEIL